MANSSVWDRATQSVQNWVEDRRTIKALERDLWQQALESGRRARGAQTPEKEATQERQQ